MLENLQKQYLSTPQGGTQVAPLGAVRVALWQPGDAGCEWL